MIYKQKQKGFLLNPFRFATGGPGGPTYELGTTNVLSGSSTSNMTIVSPFREFETGSLSRINDGNLLSASSSTIAIRGGSDIPESIQGSPVYNNGGGVIFTFPTAKRIGRVKISLSPFTPTDFFSFVVDYYDTTLENWANVGFNGNTSNYDFVTEEISFEDYPNAVSTQWRVLAVVVGGNLTEEVRFGEIEMYEWIEV